MGSLNVCIFWGHYGFIKCVCIFFEGIYSVPLWVNSINVYFGELCSSYSLSFAC